MIHIARVGEQYLYADASVLATLRTICWLSESLAATMNAAVFVMMSGEMRRAGGYFDADESAVGDTAALFSAPSTVNIARL